MVVNFKSIKVIGKFASWLPVSICDIMDIQGVILAGGAIRAFINSEKPDDFDFFFQSEESLSRACELIKSNGFKCVFKCPQGKLSTWKLRGLKVQFITEDMVGSRESLISKFDFTCCQYAYSSGCITTTSQALRDTKKRILRLNKLEYPSSTLGRFYKYQRKGYRLPEETKVNFVDRIENNINTNEIINSKRVYFD